MASITLDDVIQLARDNASRVRQDPEGLAHLDQGAAMWDKIFAENGLPLDPVSVRVAMLSLALCGFRALTQETDPDQGQYIDWLCAETSVYLVPILERMGTQISVAELEMLLPPDPESEILEVELVQRRDWGAVVAAVAVAGIAIIDVLQRRRIR